MQLISSNIFQVIVDTLQQLSEGGDSKARGLCASILKWDFIITSVVLQHIFKYTHRLSLHLQVSVTSQYFLYNIGTGFSKVLIVPLEKCFGPPEALSSFLAHDQLWSNPSALVYCSSLSMTPTTCPYSFLIVNESGLMIRVRSPIRISTVLPAF